MTQLSPTVTTPPQSGRQDLKPPPSSVSTSGKNYERAASFICAECGGIGHGRKSRVESGEVKFCSRKCLSRSNAKTKHARHSQSGAANPNYKGELTKTPSQYAQEQYRRHPEKVIARVSARHAIRVGKLLPKPCEVCNSPEVQAHHDDYSKPLDVRWLCVKHHQEHHNGHATGRVSKAIAVAAS